MEASFVDVFWSTSDLQRGKKLFSNLWARVFVRAVATATIHARWNDNMLKALKWQSYQMQDCLSVFGEFVFPNSSIF